jgi:WbqC-like protein family
MSRNRFKNSQGTLWITMPVWKKGLALQKINDVRICYDFHWTRKHLASMKVAYANAPYFEDHLPFVEELFSSTFERLIDLNIKIIRYLLNVLQIRTELVLLSELGVEAKGELLPLEICRKMGSLHFAAQYSARKYLNPDLFREAGIRLEYFRVPSPVYPQLWGDFIPDLSTFDLIFNCGPKARDILIRTNSDD